MGATRVSPARSGDGAELFDEVGAVSGRPVPDDVPDGDDAQTLDGASEGDGPPDGDGPPGGEDAPGREGAPGGEGVPGGEGAPVAGRLVCPAREVDPTAGEGEVSVGDAVGSGAFGPRTAATVGAGCASDTGRRNT